MFYTLEVCGEDDSGLGTLYAGHLSDTIEEGFESDRRGGTHFEDHALFTRRAFKGPFTRFNEQVLSFSDPDGLSLELVAELEEDRRSGWQNGSIPAEYAIRGFHSVTLAKASQERTALMLTDILGFRLLNEEDNRSRYEVGEGGPGTFVDVLSLPREPRGRVARGSVHHVA